MNPKEDPISFLLPVLRVRQPIGDFYLGVIDSKRLCAITEFDVRRILKERDFETYLGIQRPLNPKRVKEIQNYVTTLDASFPTSVILSIRGECAQYDQERGILTLSNYKDADDPERTVLYRQIAKVIDGQHRIEGLKEYHGGNPFEINVSIFVDIDIAEEGYIFSTVNLAQTKVSKSLAYDLYDLAKAKSPQKLCHNIAVALDRDEKSPLHHRIKRLGVATEGRFNETITQSTLVESLIVYISKDPVKDRDLYVRGNVPAKAGADESKLLIFRNMMIDNRDLEIVDIMWNYFEAVKLKWPTAWDNMGRGSMLNKTNGFRALMRFLRRAYLHLVGPGEVPKRQQFSKIFERIEMKDEEFNTDTFLPGTSGEVALYNAFLQRSGI